MKFPFKIQKLTPGRIAGAVVAAVLPLVAYGALRRRTAIKSQLREECTDCEKRVRRTSDGTDIKKADIWDFEKWKKNVTVKRA